MQACIVAPGIINGSLPEAVAKVKKIVPVTLILLDPDSHQVIGEYPDMGPAASPEYNDGG